MDGLADLIVTLVLIAVFGFVAFVTLAILVLCGVALWLSILGAVAAAMFTAALVAVGYVRAGS